MAHQHQHQHRPLEALYNEMEEVSASHSVCHANTMNPVVPKNEFSYLII